MGGRFGEILLLLILALLFFGPNRLPDMGRAIGKALNEFKKAVNGIPDSDSPPPQAPLRQAALPPAAPVKRIRKATSRKSKSKLVS